MIEIIDEKPLETTTSNLSLSIAEQETHVSYMRDEPFALIYTTDSTQMTRFDKLCASSPDMYTLVSDTGRGKTYKVADKKLVSFRAKKREMSDEQKKAAGERMRKSRNVSME